MSLMSRCMAAVAATVVLAAAPAQAQLMQADFSGGTTTLKGPNFNSPNAPFGAIDYRGPNVTGSFVFDQSLIPAAGTGFVNVPLPTTPSMFFQMVMGDGPSAFVFTGTMQKPGTVVQAQYNNGVFNGFSYVAPFMFENHEYQLTVNGGGWSIYDNTNGVVDQGKLAASGYINIGANGLTNVRSYVDQTSTVPEPSSMALLGTGLVGLVPMVRRRKR